MEEIYKDIPEFLGLYQASTLGNIKSLGNNKKKKEKILKANTNSRGYKCVGIKGQTIPVHQLVAMAFLKHNRSGYKMVVDHINGDRLDNRLENLKILTQRQNTSKRNGEFTGLKKSGNYWDVNICFCSFKTKSEAVEFRNKLLSYGDSLSVIEIL